MMSGCIKYNKSKVDYLIREYNNGKSMNLLAKEESMPVPSLRRILISNGIKLHKAVRRYINNEDFFRVIDTEAKAYLLGIMITDGNIHDRGVGKKSVSLISIDRELIQYLVDQLDTDYKITSRFRSDRDRQQHSIIMQSDIMAEDLISHGCVPRKSLVVKYPSSVPKNLERHFVRGLMDGDGYISVRHGQKGGSINCGFASGSPDLISGILNFLDRVGCKAYINRHKDYNCTSLMLTGDSSRRLLNLLYEDSDFAIRRKINKYRKYKNYIYDNQKIIQV